MNIPIAPQLQLILILADTGTELTSASLEVLWERWLGPQRFKRKLGQFIGSGWVSTQSGEWSADGAIRLTSEGRLKALGGKDPERGWARPWDGRWRMVLFDIPTTQHAWRQRLRRTLRRMDFGCLQNSVWISPDSLEKLSKSAAKWIVDVETLVLLEGRPCAGETDAQLVLGAWDFEWINRGYGRHEEILNNTPSPGSSWQRWKSWLEEEGEAWHHALQRDPLLPEVLLPRMYGGREAWLRRRDCLMNLFS